MFSANLKVEVGTLVAGIAIANGPFLLESSRGILIYPSGKRQNLDSQGNHLTLTRACTSCRYVVPDTSFSDYYASFFTDYLYYSNII